MKFYTVIEKTSKTSIRAIVFEVDELENRSVIEIVEAFHDPILTENDVEFLLDTTLTTTQAHNNVETIEDLNVSESFGVPYDLEAVKHRSKNPIKRLSRIIVQKFS